MSLTLRSTLPRLSRAALRAPSTKLGATPLHVIPPILPQTSPPSQTPVAHPYLSPSHVAVDNVREEQTGRSHVFLSSLLPSAASTLAAGSLLPDSFISSIVTTRLSLPDTRRHGWLLDGYPRTQTQAQLLISSPNFRPSMVILLEAPDSVLTKRMLSRRHDVRTGLPATAETPASCVSVRKDDNPTAIARRLQIYRNEMPSVIDTFESAGVTVLRVHSGEDVSVHNIWREIEISLLHVKRANGSNVLKPERIVITGPPGVGKGTQSSNISKFLGTIHVSSGDIIRRAIAAQNETK